jgi:hypothetical protein
MADLKVPKWRTRVDFQFPHREQASLAVYLSDFAHDHQGPERLSDLLNGPRDFFPAHDDDKDRTVLVNRRNVSVARVVLDIEASPSEQYTLPYENQVRILLVDGAEVLGLITYVRPDDRARVLDFLNEPPLFFPVMEKEQVALVNKLCVIRVDLL